MKYSDSDLLIVGGCRGRLRRYAGTGTQWPAYELGMGKNRPCRISPDWRITKALAPRTPRGTTAQVIPTLLSPARLRLPLHGALLATRIAD
ncbi:hypothetical protein GCM10022296_00070 [Secundilactobacillus similis DSM 23365 = JCM 2765]